MGGEKNLTEENQIVENQIVENHIEENHIEENHIEENHTEEKPKKENHAKNKKEEKSHIKCGMFLRKLMVSIPDSILYNCIIINIHTIILFILYNGSKKTK